MWALRREWLPCLFEALHEAEDCLSRIGQGFIPRAALSHTARQRGDKDGESAATFV